MIKYSFVIPTYNRLKEVSRAIDSCLLFKKNSCQNIEIIVVDDNSADGTYEFIIKKYESLMSQGFFVVKRLAENKGVVNARVIGAKIATGFWLIPLDSDNEFISNSFQLMDDFLNTNLNSPCCMFLCIDQNNNSIGNLDLQYNFFDLNDLLNKSFPEMCGVYNRIKFIEIFDNNLLIKIRRFEHIGNLRMIRKYGNFMVCHLVIRKYYTDSCDRLSGKSGVLKDSYNLFLGNLFILFEFLFSLNFMSFFVFLSKVAYYALFTVKNSIVRFFS